MKRRRLLILSIGVVVAYHGWALRERPWTGQLSALPYLGRILRYEVGDVPSFIYTTPEGGVFSYEEVAAQRPWAAWEERRFFSYLNQLRRSFECKGAKFVVVPIPSKSTVVDAQWGQRRCSPTDHRRCGELDRGSPFDRVAASHHPSLVRVKPALERLHAQGLSPYLQLDTHLSSLGVAEVARQVVRHLEGRDAPLEVVGASTLEPINRMQQLGLPPWFRRQRPELSPRESLYQLLAPPSPTPGRVFLYGTSYSTFYRGKGVSLGRVLAHASGKTLMDRAILGKGPYAALRKGQRIGDRPKAGDWVVWEFPSHHFPVIPPARLSPALGWCSKRRLLASPSTPR